MADDNILDMFDDAAPASEETPNVPVASPGEEAVSTEGTGTDTGEASEPAQAAADDTGADGAEPEPEPVSAESNEAVELRVKLLEQEERLAELEARLAAASAKPQQPDNEVIDFLGESEVDEWFSSKEKINELLSNVYRKGREDSLRAIPSVVAHNVKQQVDIHTRTQEFYKTNKDLLPYPKIVARVAQDLAAKNPDWTLDKLYDEMGKVTREKLHLVQKAQKTSEKPAGFVAPKSGPRPQPKKAPAPDPLQAEIDEMLRALGR